MSESHNAATRIKCIIIMTNNKNMNTLENIIERIYLFTLHIHMRVALNSICGIKENVSICDSYNIFYLLLSYYIFVLNKK